MLNEKKIDMIILKNRYRYLIIIFLFLSLVNFSSQTKNNNDCKLYKNDTDVILDSKRNILKKNLADYYKNSNNKYDIIFYRSKSDDDNISFHRIYRNSEDKWIFIEIHNDKIISQKEIEVDNSEIENLFTDFKTQGMSKYCGCALIVMTICI